jgi:glycosyltransferase involved in cell wall biosynthesis
MHKLSIIIPFYNEEKTLLELIEKIFSFDFSSLCLVPELILINDGSTDSSHEIITALLNKKPQTALHYYTHSVNRGKGAALRTGFAHATGDFILVQDADLEYDPAEYSALLLPLLEGKASVVYGSRFLSKENLSREKNMYILHYFGNKLLTTVTNLLYQSHLSDMETGYKAMKKEVLDAITLTADRFEIEPELTAKILRHNIQILSIPIRFNARSFKEGKKITFIDGIIALWWLVKCRFFK